MKELIATLGILILTGCNSPVPVPEISGAQQDAIATCKKNGGSPVLNLMGWAMIDCKFPITITNK